LKKSQGLKQTLYFLSVSFDRFPVFPILGFGQKLLEMADLLPRPMYPQSQSAFHQNFFHLIRTRWWSVLDFSQHLRLQAFEGIGQRFSLQALEQQPVWFFSEIRRRKRLVQGFFQRFIQQPQALRILQQQAEDVTLQDAAWGYDPATIYSLYLLFPTWFAGLFTHAPNVMHHASHCLRITGISYAFLAAGIIASRGLDGAGNTVPGMAIGLLTLWGVQVPLTYALARWDIMGADGVWLGLSIANILNGILFIYWFRRGGWKRKRV